MYLSLEKNIPRYSAPGQEITGVKFGIFWDPQSRPSKVVKVPTAKTNVSLCIVTDSSRKLTLRGATSLFEKRLVTSKEYWRVCSFQIVLTIACFESTNGVLAERRLKTLRELDSHAVSTRTLEELGKSIGRALTFNPYDVPFALLYFCSSEFGTDSSRTAICPNSDGLLSLESSGRSTEKTDPIVWVYELGGAVGIPENHVLAPKVVEIRIHNRRESTAEDKEYIWPFRQMAQEQMPVEITDIPAETLQAIEHQGWPELPSKAIAVPILGARDMEGKETMMGMLVFGINPRRPFDDAYQEFVAMCGRQISASMITVRSIEEEAARSEELAALNRDRTLFFNSVSHELRTPLALILGPLDECLEDPSLQQQHRLLLDMVARNARRLLRLVNSLLDFSRVEAGKMSVSFRETSLQKYTADLASLFRSAIERGGVKYVVDTSGKELPVWVDRDMWEVISLCIQS